MSGTTYTRRTERHHARSFQRYLNDPNTARAHDAHSCSLPEGRICRWRVQYLHRDDRGSDKTAYENKRKAELERKYPGSSVEISTMPTLINFADRGPGSGTWKCYEIDLVRLKAQTELLGADSRYDPALLDYLAKMSTSYGPRFRTTHEHVYRPEASESSATAKGSHDDTGPKSDMSDAGEGTSTHSADAQEVAMGSDATDAPPAYAEEDPNPLEVTDTRAAGASQRSRRSAAGVLRAFRSLQR